MTAKNRFLIDAAFIVERIYKTFLGAPLIVAVQKDNTFTFGCVRDFLRLRRNLGVKAGVIILGKEVYSVSSRDGVIDLNGRTQRPQNTIRPRFSEFRSAGHWPHAFWFFAHCHR